MSATLIGAYAIYKGDLLKLSWRIAHNYFPSRCCHFLVIYFNGIISKIEVHVLLEGPNFDSFFIQKYFQSLTIDASHIVNTFRHQLLNVYFQFGHSKSLVVGSEGHLDEGTGFHWFNLRNLLVSHVVSPSLLEIVRTITNFNYEFT